ncbi:MAG: Hpt domain-containing protein [Solobacterium sp.]|nr:Hpt domain-containing protein [Solobacterium sp.]
MTIQELYETIGGDYESAKRTLMMDAMISRFIVKFPDDPSFEKLMSASDSLDPTILFEGAHAMKGVCGNLGLISLSTLASKITEEFRPGNTRSLSDEEVKQILNTISEQYTTAVQAIQAFAQE